jgi:hypothetical protein
MFTRNVIYLFSEERTQIQAVFTPKKMSEANRDAAEQWALRAASAITDGNLDDALRFCEKSLHLNPHDPRVQSLKGRILAGQSGEGSPPSSGRAASPPQSSAGAAQSHRSADGLRFPTAPANVASSVRPRPVANTRPPGSMPTPVLRPHTPEQAAAVRSIKIAADYYEVLGLQKNATPEDIKRVGAFAGAFNFVGFVSHIRVSLLCVSTQGYRKQAQKVHPDKCPGVWSCTSMDSLTRVSRFTYHPDKCMCY